MYNNIGCILCVYKYEHKTTSLSQVLFTQGKLHNFPKANFMIKKNLQQEQTLHLFTMSKEFFFQN